MNDVEKHQQWLVDQYNRNRKMLDLEIKQNSKESDEKV